MGGQTVQRLRDALQTFRSLNFSGDALRNGYLFDIKSLIKFLNISNIFKTALSSVYI